MDQEIQIIVIVFASIILIVFLGIIAGMFKTWANRNSSNNLSENQEFLSALREFKEKTDKRLSNLEAIVSDDNPHSKDHSEVKKKLPEKEQKSAIEIEIENEKKKENQKESGNLRNMLNQ